MEQTQASLVLRGRRPEVQVPFRIPSLLRFGGTGLFPMHHTILKPCHTIATETK